jgi:hypothetical protein
MRSLFISLTIVVGLVALAFGEDWLQWGQNAQHTGRALVLAQNPSRILGDLIYDPFVPQEQAAVEMPARSRRSGSPEHTHDRRVLVGRLAEILGDQRPGRKVTAMFIDMAFGALIWPPSTPVK